MTITDKDLDLFKERSKTELASTGDISRLAWDYVVPLLCDEVRKLRVQLRMNGIPYKEIDLKGSENVTTVYELMAALRKMPNDAKVCGSKPNGHDEYDCEERPFWVQHYNDGSDNGLVYVGIDYKHPN